MRPSFSTVTTFGTEPITLDQALEHVRVDSQDDLDYISALIPVAREYVEEVTGRVMKARTMLACFESWGVASPDVFGRIPLDGSPLLSVQSVKYYLPDATELTTMATTEYRVITTRTPGVVQIYGDFPSVDDRPDAIQIAYTCGYDCGAPPTLLHAVKLLITHLYEHRVPVSFAATHEIPYSLKTLIEHNKIGGWS